MGYLVYINGNEAWCASSLRAAQLLANGFICDGKELKIVSGNESMAERTWLYDYNESRWVERSVAGQGSASSRLFEQGN